MTPSDPTNDELHQLIQDDYEAWICFGNDCDPPHTGCEETRAKLEALIKERERLAKINEILQFSKENSELAPKETWEQWAYRVTDYFNARLKELQAQEEEYK